MIEITVDLMDRFLNSKQVMMNIALQRDTSSY